MFVTSLSAFILSIRDLWKRKGWEKSFDDHVYVTSNGSR